MSQESIFFENMKPPEGTSAEKTSEGYPYFQDKIHVDQSKDVPLAASALHKDGQMYGIAVDKDAPITDMGIKGWSPFHGVYVHEQAEFHHMNHLMLTGMSPKDAYHESHDKIATPTETAYVRGVASAHGKDPDQFLDEYKNYWRDVTSKAKEPPFDRHPDAHTTTYGLDEHELGMENLDPAAGPVGAGKPNILDYLYEFANKGLFGVAKKAGYNPPGQAVSDVLTGKDTQAAMGIFGGSMAAGANYEMLNRAKSLEGLGESAYNIFKETGWFKGYEGRWKFELPHNADIMPDPPRRGTLPKLFKFPELYKHYPELKDVRYSIEDFNVTQPDWPKTVMGAFDPDENLITLDPKRHEEQGETLFSSLLHEVQHLVQHQEGFPGGSNLYNEYERAKYAVRIKAIEDKDPEKHKELLRLALDLEKKKKEFGKYMYRRNLGEIEARLAEKRGRFAPYERAIETPTETHQRYAELGWEVPPFIYPEEYAYWETGSEEDISMSDKYQHPRSASQDISEIQEDLKEAAKRARENKTTLQEELNKMDKMKPRPSRKKPKIFY